LGTSGTGEKPLPPDRRERLRDYLEALEAGRLFPPSDVGDRSAWDNYWKEHIKVGAIDQGVSDRISSDETLPGLLDQRGSRTILCAGNGLSMEAISLALHGFDVTALDISAVPSQVFLRTMQDPEHPVRRIPGFCTGDDGSVAFGASVLIDPEVCPPMHRSADHPPRGGGSVSFVTGNLMKQDVCPGPFDVVIERRTLQLFQGVDQISALDRLVARLGHRGTFVSQEHQGAWRPGDARMHYAEARLKALGFVLRSHGTGDKAAARLAYLIFSTG
jgi:hypothetical protein